MPDERGIEPGYEQKSFGDERKGRLRLTASKDGREGSPNHPSRHGSLCIHLRRRCTSLAPLCITRHGWLQVAKGTVEINGEALSAGDGAAISDVADIAIKATTDSEFLLFDLAA